MDVYVVYEKGKSRAKEHTVTSGIYLHETKERVVDAIVEKHPNYNHILPINWIDVSDNIYEGTCTIKTPDGEIDETYVIERVDGSHLRREEEEERQRFYDEARRAGEEAIRRNHPDIADQILAPHRPVE